MLPPARRRGYWRSLVCLAAIVLGGGGRDVASEKSRRCHLQQPPGPPPTSTAVFCVYQKPRTLVWGTTAKDKADPVRVEKAFPAIVSKAQFKRVNRKLRSRAPKRSHPRRVGSTYLLSGLVRCRTCNRALSGQDAKSGRFAYYVCQSVMKRGSGACDAPGSTPGASRRWWWGRFEKTCSPSPTSVSW